MASQPVVTPWRRSRGWRLTSAIMASVFIVGFGYAGWWAAHQRPGDPRPAFAFVLVPVAAIGPPLPTWPEFIGMAILNIGIWAAILYSAIALVARVHR